MELTPVTRKALKARAHLLHPVVLVGDKGLTEAVLREVDLNLKSHELIKVRAADAERDEREAMLATMCARLGAQPVQHIGKILVIYRENPPAPPPARRKAPPQRSRARTVAKVARTTRAPRPPRPGAKPSIAPARPRGGSARTAKPVRPRSGSGRALPAAPARRPANSGRALATTPARRPANSGRALAKAPARRPGRTR
jgi:RNA-binding protein